MRASILVVVAVGVLSSTAVPAAASVAGVGATRARSHGVANINWSVTPAPTASGRPREGFTFVADPGAARTDTVRLTNYSDQLLDLHLYPAGAYNSDTGSFAVRDAGSPRDDLAAWMHLGRDEVRLQPGETTDVPLDLELPRDARPGDHVAAIVAELSGEVRSSDGHVVQIDRVVSARVDLRVSGAIRPRLEIDDLRVSFVRHANPFALGWISITYLLRNTGNVCLAGTESVVVRSPFGVQVPLHEVGQVPELLPGSSLRRVADVGQAHQLGQLRTELTVRALEPGAPAGSPAPVVDSALVGTSAVPWPGLAGAAVVVVVVVSVVLGLHRRRRHRPPAPA